MSKPWLERLRRILSRRIGSCRGLKDIALRQRSERRSGAKQKIYPSAHALGFSLADLNIEAARRQATLGKGYARNGETSKRLRELKNYTVILPPHQPWTGNYTDWDADPFGDRNWRFQFQTLRWINPYLWDAFAGDEDSRDEWKRIVRSWARANVPYYRAQDEYAWKDMTDGNRAIQISIGAPLVDLTDSWYLHLLVEHRNWLLDDENIVEGNHGLHQNLGLFVVAVVLNDNTGVRRAIERLGEQILQVFDEKGLNNEGSVGYHQMNLVWWLEAKRRLTLERYDLPAEALDRLDKAGRTMGHLLLPDGTMPQIGDGGRGKGGRGLHPFLDQVAEGKIQEMNLGTFHHFPNGFSVFRSGWGESQPLKDESHTIIRHGVDLLRHSHDDRGSIHIYTLGRRWITDGGFHSYQQGNPDRIYTKSRLAHSLVDLPSQIHDPTGDVPALFTENNHDLMSIEILDANFESARWYRRVVYLQQFNIWVIWDRVESESPDHVQQQWLADVGLKVSQLNKRALELRDHDARLRMQWLGDRPALDLAIGDGSSESKRGLIGVRWKTMKPASSIHAQFHGAKVESIVVISNPDEHDLNLEIHDHDPHHSFNLKLNTTEISLNLEFLDNATNLV